MGSSIPFKQAARIGAYVVGKTLSGKKHYPLVLMLEPLFRCNLACAGCGAEFDCSLSGPCWCSDEAFRLPMPLDGGDCLCPDCLRKAAARAAAKA